MKREVISMSASLKELGLFLPGQLEIRQQTKYFSYSRFLLSEK